MDFVEEAKTLLPGLKELRRALHRDPEIGLDLPRTQQKVLDALNDLGLDITLGTRTTSVTAVLRGATDGPTVLLRGDMDALPVVEENDLPYRSTNGAMHACGHDLHTAGLVGAAKLLAAHKDELKGTVVFMFQPGEEGHDGAKVMIEEGVLDAAGHKPDAAYGIHVMPGAPGVFTTKPGPVMAGASELRVTIHGEGGHGSAPMNAKDPVPVVAALAGELPSLVTRRFSPFEPLVVTVTQLRGSDAVNVIPGSASLAATVRSFAPDVVERLRTEVAALADGLAAAHGCTAEVDLKVTFPVTMNDDDETAVALGVLAGVFGAERAIEGAEPVTASEDFSLVLQQVPGTFLFLSASPDGLENPAYNHSPKVLFNDDVLGDQAAALAELAWARLER
ncbi:M20 metallopeptidase family protein [Specibacter cremeus]|uniref:M20 metallopeptidase family protein n=1 Tax=Specibacter cremeus TaxID=1629051 RepID=UPI000F78EB8C|nr:M20 family metallopeptidase [Specibacter cremeus]